MGVVGRLRSAVIDEMKFRADWIAGVPLKELQKRHRAGQAKLIATASRLGLNPRMRWHRSLATPKRQQPAAAPEKKPSGNEIIAAAIADLVARRDKLDRAIETLRGILTFPEA